MSKENRNIGILIVEKDHGDANLIQGAFTDGSLNQNFILFGDGESAIGYLKKLDEKDLSSRPDLVFLDMNLPGKNGFEVLKEIKFTPALRSIPVVVLTSSDSDEHITRSYKLNANACIAKPNDYGEFADIMKTVGDFWLNTVKLPRPENDIY